MDKRNLVSFVACKCPRCGKGKVFKYKLFQLKKFSETFNYCSECRLDYMPETGFFFGAMYFSYAMLVATVVTWSVALSVFNQFDKAVYIIPTVVGLSLPLIFRYSRMFMLYIVYPNMYKDKYKNSYVEDNSEKFNQ